MPAAPTADIGRGGRPGGAAGPVGHPAGRDDVAWRHRRLRPRARGHRRLQHGRPRGHVGASRTPCRWPRSLADAQPSDDTETLLDAVRYYAGLPAEEYVEATVSSPDFLRSRTSPSECAYRPPPAW